MKKSTLFIIGILFITKAFSQGSIQSFQVVPASPTVNDIVKVYVTCEFSSGSCTVDNQAFSTTGNYTDASAIHCIGMLTYICTNVDSFNLGHLQAGNHSFRFVLDVGSGGPGCSPGIIPDDIDSVHFTVSAVTGIDERAKNNSSVLVYPNPVSSIAMIKIKNEIALKNAQLKILDSQGNTVNTIEGIKTNEVFFNRSGLANGIYAYQLLQDGKIIATGKIVLE